MAADVFVSIQGETSVIGCGECRKRININDYVTSVSTEASVDSPPGSATIQLTVPDNDVVGANLYTNNQCVIVPMMEIEIYSKGYYLVGGMPQYYKIFWGLVSTVTKSWSNGVTTIQLACKDILRWWELTQQNLNPAFLNTFGTSAGGYQLYQNQFAGANPYTVIMALARDAMGDFSFTTGSFTSFKPEDGKEGLASGNMADTMLYWQKKFGNIWNSLVMYGSSGQVYTTTGVGGTFSPVQMSEAIFKNEAKFNEGHSKFNAAFKLSPGEIAAYKQELSRAGDVEFFQNESSTKLQVAQQVREQSGYEFYCDPCGDIVFKPPFYNLNVLPNKPVSWVQDFEVIDDSTTDSEEPVITHMTSSGNAFGGVWDPGLNDEITTPHTGVHDYHLMRRYGVRHMAYQVEWAGNPQKLFYHTLDWMDRQNSKRQGASVTIPLRPEIKMGFPIWFPRHESFFYVSGVSHQYSVGGQATTTLTLTARRQKFVAPVNIGKIEFSGLVGEPTPNVKVESDGKRKNAGTVTTAVKSYSISFPDNVGDTTTETRQAVIRDQRTGHILGFPNAVMVFRHKVDGARLAAIIASLGSPQKAAKASRDQVSTGTSYQARVNQVFQLIHDSDTGKVIQRIRSHRYEAGASDVGAYDYAHDVGRNFKEFEIIRTNRMTWSAGTGPTVVDPTINSANNGLLVAQGKRNADIRVKEAEKRLADTKKDHQSAQKAKTDAGRAVALATKALEAARKALPTGLGVVPQPGNDYGLSPAQMISSLESDISAEQAVLEATQTKGAAIVNSTTASSSRSPAELAVTAGLLASVTQRLQDVVFGGVSVTPGELARLQKQKSDLEARIHANVSTSTSVTKSKTSAGVSQADKTRLAASIASKRAQLAKLRKSQLSTRIGTVDIAGSVTAAASTAQSQLDAVDSRLQSIIFGGSPDVVPGEVTKLTTEKTALQKQLAGYNKQLAAVASVQKKAATSLAAYTKAQNDLSAAQALLADADTNLKKTTVDSSQASDDLRRIKAAGNLVESIPQLGTMVRPVSDEFGFEVIGHYKYGRGSYIDRGQLKVPDPSGGSAFNNFSVQFAATGGFLTDNITVSQAEAVDFAKSFEQMQPDDYATGASFTGTSVKRTDTSPGDVTLTSSNTYTTDMRSNVGHSVYVDVDSTKRARLLDELSPSMELGLSDSNDKCACSLGHDSWFSLIPANVIADLVNKTAGASTVRLGSDSSTVQNLALAQTTTTVKKKSTTTDITLNADLATLGPASSGSKGIVGVATNIIPGNAGDAAAGFVGDVSAESFFDSLNDFLSRTFETDNALRDETFVQVGGVQPSQADSGLGDNVLEPPGGSLFDRAALGDPDAEAALRNQANFNFGLTGQATAALKAAYAGAPNVWTAIGGGAAAGVALPGNPTFSTGPSKTTPFANPSFQHVVNPRMFNSATGSASPSPINPSTKT